MKSLIGNLYQTKDRWYWKVQLPQETKRRTIPLKPLGAKHATKDYAVAVECAKRILLEHIHGSNCKPDAESVKTVSMLVLLYRDHIQEYYAGSTEIKNIGYALTYLEKHCPDLEVDEFDSLKLMKIRDRMIEDGSSRSTINRRVNMIKRMFKWGVSMRYCSPYVTQTLEAVENLKQGRTKARESKKIKAVPVKHVEAVLPHLSDVVADMVRVQLITGMRSTELCLMRPCDIDRSEDVWIYRPSIFKGQHRAGYTRFIALGSQAQQILSPYLLNKDHNSKEYLFKPKDGAGAKRHRHYNPHYNKDSYGLAVRRKIHILNKQIKDNCLNDAEYENKKILSWTPHQLRHTFATTARKQEGTETARASLGHTRIQTLDVYAERDLGLAVEYARKYG